MQQNYQCPSCGSPVGFDVEFCGNCSTPLDWSAFQQIQLPPQQPQMGYEQQQHSLYQQQYDYGGQSTPQTQTIIQAMEVICGRCGRNVSPIKKFSWLWFLFVFGVFYLAYFAFFKKERACPACGWKNVYKIKKLDTRWTIPHVKTLKSILGH